MEHKDRDVNKSHESGVFMGLTECKLYFFFQIYFEISITCSAQFFYLEFFQCEIFEPICFIHKDTLFYLILSSVNLDWCAVKHNCHIGVFNDYIKQLHVLAFSGHLQVVLSERT